MTVFESLGPIKQYRCGVYHIDLYFPAQKVAVECDESHDQYCPIKEHQRQEFIERTLECRFVRYKPQAADFSVYSLMAKLMPLLAISRQSP